MSDLAANITVVFLGAVLIAAYLLGTRPLVPRRRLGGK